jgi:hypothetical protein
MAAVSSAYQLAAISGVSANGSMDQWQSGVIVAEKHGG